MEKFKKPSGIPKRTSSSNECPKCKGTGWELYQSSDTTENIYGQPIMIDYARRCNCQTNVFANMDRTEFPSMYRDCDLYRFDWECYGMDMKDVKSIAFSFFNKFEKWQEEGKGLYIWSKTPGSGKTYLSACLGKSVMMRTQKVIKYVTPVGYMDKVSEGYNDKSLPDPSRVYRECTLLILDDLGTQMKSDWHSQELFRLIDQRSSNGLVTIITSNYNVEDLKVDDRLKSRILKSSIVLHMPEVSIRNQKAAAEQGAFVNRILGG